MNDQLNTVAETAQSNTELARAACLNYAVKFFRLFPDTCVDFYGGADEFYKTVVFYAEKFVAPRLDDRFSAHEKVKYSTLYLRHILNRDLEKQYKIGLNGDRKRGAIKFTSLPTVMTEEDGEKQFDVAAPVEEEKEFTDAETNQFITVARKICKEYDREKRAEGKPDRAIALTTFVVYMKTNREGATAAREYGLTRAAWSARFQALERLLRARMSELYPNT